MTANTPALILGCREMSENALSPKQHRAISALLTCNGITEAAAVAEVDPRTIGRWLKQPAFRAALTAAESDLIDGATRRLLRLQDGALQVVEGFLDAASTAPEGVKLRAALAALDHLLKLRSLRDIEQRLQALEQGGGGGGAGVDRLSELRKIGEV